MIVSLLAHFVRNIQIIIINELMLYDDAIIHVYATSAMETEFACVKLVLDTLHRSLPGTRLHCLAKISRVLTTPLC